MNRLLVVCWTGIILITSALGAAQRATIILDLPGGIPAGLVLPIPGRVVDAPPTAQIFELNAPGFSERSLVAQREHEGDVVWVVAAFQKKQARTSRVRVQATVVKQTDVPPRLTIAKKPTGLMFRDAGQPVMFYQRAPHSLDGGEHVAANYVHPLYGLDGEILTQDFPADHKHHHGIFWAWHQLWVGKLRAGDPWINKDFLPVVRETDVVEEGPVFATLATRVEWTSPLLTDPNGVKRPIVVERGEFRVFRRGGDSRHVDFSIQLTAQLDEVRIGGSENVKGYSGFTVRMRPPAGIVIHDQTGRLNGDHVGTPSRWGDISGRFGSGQRVAGLSILNHPSYPVFPPKWLLRHYGMQNVAWPGRQPVGLERGRPRVLRNRLVIHRGDHQQARAGELQRGFELLSHPRAAAARRSQD